MTFAFLDIETANSEHTSICAVGISVQEDGVEIDHFYTLVKPAPFRLDFYNRDINQLDARDLYNAPEFTTVWPDIKERLINNIVIAHNAPFDMDCLDAALDNWDIIAPQFIVIDTLAIAKQKYAHAKLAELAKIYDVPYVNAHNALADARTLGAIYWQMRQDFTPRICAMFASYFKTPKVDTTPPEPKSDLPYQNPKRIEFKGKKFVLTGEFITARRKDVATAIEQRGGIVQQCTSGKTDYIIVGSVASGAWSNEDYGSKIETALKHPNIVFIAEKDFTPRLK